MEATCESLERVDSLHCDTGHDAGHLESDMARLVGHDTHSLGSCLAGCERACISSGEHSAWLGIEGYLWREAVAKEQECGSCTLRKGSTLAHCSWNRRNAIDRGRVVPTTPMVEHPRSRDSDLGAAVAD